MTAEQILDVLDEHPSYLVEVCLGRLRCDINRASLIGTLCERALTKSYDVSIEVDHDCNTIEFSEVPRG